MKAYQKDIIPSESVRKQRLRRLKAIFGYFQTHGYEISKNGLDVSATKPNREIYFFINYTSAVRRMENFVYVEIEENRKNLKVSEPRRIDLLDDYEKSIRNLERGISLTRAWASG